MIHFVKGVSHDFLPHFGHFRQYAVPVGAGFLPRNRGVNNSPAAETRNSCPHSRHWNSMSYHLPIYIEVITTLNFAARHGSRLQNRIEEQATSANRNRQSLAYVTVLNDSINLTPRTKLPNPPHQTTEIAFIISGCASAKRQAFLTPILVANKIPML